MTPKVRLFFILWLLGLAGVLSLLLVDLSAVIEALPIPQGENAELPPPALLKLVSLIQPTVLMSLAVIVGIWLAPKVGLHAPVCEAVANGDNAIEKLRPQIVPGILTGIAGGAAIVLTWAVAKPYFTSEFTSRAQRFNDFLPTAVRFFYGGFTEEILLRWGLMTFFVWAGWRLSARVRAADSARPSSGVYIAAILLSALAFAAGHLPVASLLNGGLSTPVVIYVLTANSIFGVFAGFLYWRRGLEAAMLAHIFVHIVLLTAIMLQV